MQRICYLLLACLAAGSLLLPSCSGSLNEVVIEHRNFGDEVDPDQNLIFSFNKDLCPDSLLGLWDTTRYVTLQPKVLGKYKWNSPRELIFSPAEPFAPSSPYTITLTDRLLNLKPKSKLYFGGEKQFQFHTWYLDMKALSGLWEKSELSHGMALLKATLEFNYPVEPATLQPLLSFVVNGETKPYTLLTAEKSKTVSVAMDGFSVKDLKTVTLKAAIKPGLPCPGSSYKTTKPLEKTVDISPPARLEILAAEGRFEDNYGYIDVETNQAVDFANIDESDFISIPYHDNYTIEPTDRGFRIKSSSFYQYSEYDVVIKEGLSGELGGKLETEWRQTVSFGEQRSQLSFTSGQGLYMSGRGSRNLGISITNIEKVKVTVTKIYENNIATFLANNRYTDYRNDGRSFNFSDNNLNVYGDELYTRQYSTKDLAKQGGQRLLHLSLEDMNRFKGIYLVQVNDEQDYYRRATKLVSVSDIGLIAKVATDEIYIFANSLSEARPVNGLSVSLISTSNQTIMTANTGGEGVAVFSNVKAQTKGFSPGMITATDGKDFNFMSLADTRVEDSRFDVAGLRPNESGYQAFVYGDRDLYRPGEAVHLRVVVRDETWATTPGLPVKLKVLTPNGQELRLVKQTLSEQGSTGLDVATSPGSLTGTYRVEVFTFNDVLIGSETFNVEEFMPDRISVNMSIDKKMYKPGDSLVARVAAYNLFGPPATDRKAEAQCMLNYKTFTPEKYKDYHFGLTKRSNQSLDHTSKETQTNSEGKAVFGFGIKAEYTNCGMLEGKVFATVFDETGRPVNRMENFEVSTQPCFIGMKLDGYWLDVKELNQVPVVACDAAGNSIQAAARVQLVRHEYYNWARWNNDNMDYQSDPKERIISDKLMTVNRGGSSLPLQVNTSGEYELRLYVPGSKNYVSRHFYAYSWGYTENNSFAINTEGQISIESDKKSYKPGDQAKLLFKTPFNGRLLVTVERNKVLEYHYLQTEKRAASLNLVLRDAFVPNVYVSATLFRPADGGGMPLTVAHGFAPLMCEKAEWKMPVQIIAAASSRSRTKQTVRVKAGAGAGMAEVTIAVVDEGILQMKNFKTPDPYGFFYQKRALAVSSHDVYPFLLPDLKLKKSSTGGGGEADMIANMSAGRVNPLQNNRVKLVAFWSGPMKLNGAGEATYSFDIPQYSGDLRIMAVAHKGRTFGNAESHMKVADPVVVSMGLPRFLSPGDTAYVPVTLFNTTKNEMKASATIRVGGVVAFAGNASASAVLPAGGEQRLVYKVVASKGIGQASVAVSVNAGGDVYADKVDLTVRPSAGLVKESGSGTLTGNSSTDIKCSYNCMEGTGSGKLYISKNPLMGLAQNMDYLVQYPHGCVEQTVSAVFPQLYYADLVKALGRSNTLADESKLNIQEAIKKLNGMQQYNGAMSYWPGSHDPCWWGTTYAAHFMLEAQKAGYEVNKTILNNCFQYMLERLKQKESVQYSYFDGETMKSRSVASYEIPYSLYVLAIAGQFDVSTMNYYKANPDLLTLDGRYLLACAYLALNDVKSFQALLPSSFSGEQAADDFGGSFNSYTRNLSLSLAILMERDPANAQVPVMVKHLSDQLHKDRYLNTQEMAFSLLALGKYARRNNLNKGAVQVTVTVGGKTLATYTGQSETMQINLKPGQTFTLQSNAPGSAFYYYTLQGTSADGKYKQEDSYLQIRRQFLDRFGTPLTNNTFKQNDLVVVKLTLTNPEGAYIENVAVTDMLPAGFELENPRVSAVPELYWISDATEPQYMDYRDDRINFFTSIGGGYRQQFYYLVRCVSPGSFTQGPASADAMYKGEYHSYHGAGKIVIRQ